MLKKAINKVYFKLKKLRKCIKNYLIKFKQPLNVFKLRFCVNFQTIENKYFIFYRKAKQRNQSFLAFFKINQATSFKKEIQKFVLLQ